MLEGFPSLDKVRSLDEQGSGEEGLVERWRGRLSKQEQMNKKAETGTKSM